MAGMPIAQWRPVPGSGQSLSLTGSAAATFANAIGAVTKQQVYAIAVKLAPASTAYIATIVISKAGTAATASTDYPIASTDPPQILACAPGDQVSVYAGANGTAYLCELTH